MLAWRREVATGALKVLEAQCSKEPFLVGNEITIADIAVFAYTHLAGDAGIDLTPYPAVKAWIERVSAVATEPVHAYSIDPFSTRDL
jgi:glutathione S-transferase